MPDSPVSVPLTQPTTATAAAPGRLNLCAANFGSGDTYPNDKPVAGIDFIPPFLFFTCSDRADGVISFPCTGSKHLGAQRIVCSCECHERGRNAT